RPRRWPNRKAGPRPDFPWLGFGRSRSPPCLQLGGQFWLQSDHSLGQILTAQPPSAQQFPGLQRRPVNVMVVDDDPHWLSLLLHQLQPHGFSVTTLADPQSFWQVLQSVQPDALILDAKIPEIDGFELCQIVRHDPHWQALPILFLSILNDSKSQQLAFAAGADDYLLKPVAMGELAQRVCSRLQRVRAVQSA
ncbi:MAG: response regulator, partial [Synechococcales cyanobacterium RM1_1_8]|nr:response regulator [Synechococcales cyanobacterium RM1_1_8]